MITNHPKFDQFSNPRHIEAISIGNIAFESLKSEMEGEIHGVTSQGIFIKTTGRWLHFLSFEPQYGPLTINLPVTNLPEIPLHNGMRVRIASGQISVLEANLVIRVNNAFVWQPGPPSSHPLPAAERAARIRLAGEKIITSSQGNGLSSILPYLLKLPDHKNFDIQEITHPYINILHKQRYMGGLPSTASIAGLLGSGPGLTPSGDDFTIGLLLAVNRWETELLPGHNLDLYNRKIVDAAYQTTTTLSANLIECAAQGLGDQRLIEALDWLMSGTGQDNHVIDNLLTWGSSSGSDVFVGYVVALSP
ncbi:MAG: DUF2877 domain-containing protein [Anaerolineales bacterium]|nr:DUF2877 domain-containing protein [Anaerolineales bacterium]